MSFFSRSLPLLIVISVLVGGFFLPSQVYAQGAWWDDVVTGLAAAGGGCWLGSFGGPIGCAIGAGIGAIGGFSVGDRLISWLLDWIPWLVDIATKWALGIILPFVLELVKFGIVISTAGVTKFQPVLDAAAVTTSIANLLLIAILIIIAMATITGLGGENYQVRRALPRLIFLVLIVNFSVVIVGLVADMGNTLMRFFWNNSGFVGSGTVTLDAYILKNMNLSTAAAQTTVNTIQEILEKSGVFPNTSATIVKAGLYLIILFLGAYAVWIFLRMALLFIMRIAVLWILIITAPAVFILGIIPLGAGYLARWWRELFNWSFVGPIMFFFLFFALIIWGQLNIFLASTPSAPSGGIVALPSAYAAETVSGVGNIKAFSLFLIFPIVGLFLMYALNISKQMAGEVANAIIDSVIGLGKSLTLGGAALATGAALSGVGGVILKNPRIGRLAERLQATRFGRGIGTRLGYAHQAVSEKEGKLALAESKSWEDVVGKWDQATLERNLGPRSFRDARQRQAIALAALAKNVPFSQSAYTRAKGLAISGSKLERELKKSYLHYDTGLETTPGKLDLKKVASRATRENINVDLMLTGTSEEQKNDILATMALVWDRGDMSRITKERADLVAEIKEFQDSLQETKKVNPRGYEDFIQRIATNTGRLKEEVEEALGQQNKWIKSPHATRAAGRGGAFTGGSAPGSTPAGGTTP